MRGILIFLVFWLVFESTHEQHINDSEDDIDIEQRNELEYEEIETKQTGEDKEVNSSGTMCWFCYSQT